MSRTFRKNCFGESMRDGKIDFATIIGRDNRVTGLRDRDHRWDRRRTRSHLRSEPENDVIIAGTRRRYTARYGDYEL